MRLFNKILLIVVLFLLLMIVGEVGYYFYILNKQQIGSSQTNTVSRTVQIPQSVSVNPPNTVITINEDKKRQNDDILKNVNESILFYRNWFKNNDNGRVYLTIDQPGVVNTIFTKEGSTIMLVTNEKGEKISGFTVNDRMKFYKMRNNEKETVPFQQVKTGDKIIIRVEKNMLTNEENLKFILQ